MEEIGNVVGSYLINAAQFHIWICILHIMWNQT